MRRFGFWASDSNDHSVLSVLDHRIGSVTFCESRRYYRGFRELGGLLIGIALIWLL
jgi:hypothetical protein